MYGFSVEITDNFDDAVNKVTNLLQQEGFGVLTEIDVKAVMKKKLDVEKRPYKILGACNPVLANKAITAEPEIGLLLPCNVVVRENEKGAIIVDFMDPTVVLDLVKRDDISDIAHDVRDRLKRVQNNLLD